MTLTARTIDPTEEEQLLDTIDRWVTRDVRPIVRHHHERWDGSGYPDGLAGEAIPMVARVLQLADAYDALRVERVYKPSMTPEESAAMIRDETARGLAARFEENFEKFEGAVSEDVKSAAIRKAA